ncbi:MAG: rhomboid family intramembrane serine protease [Cryomorphaceae bacterium]|nr:rhomboid family intramembrane serine protease [Cryomorphaceae bacterium]
MPTQQKNYWTTPLIFVMIMWLVFWIDTKWFLDLYTFGILPLDPVGLRGIVFHPFLHGSLSHLISNTFPMLVLGVGIGLFYPDAARKIFLLAWVATGIAVWFIGQPNYHIGASGMVYAFAFFIFFSGIFRGHPQLVALSLLVAFLYGSLVWGVFPIEDHISWESHLSGSIVGLITALWLRNNNPIHVQRHFWKKNRHEWDPGEEALLDQLDYWKTEEQLKKEAQEKEKDEKSNVGGHDMKINYIYRKKEDSNE